MPVPNPTPVTYHPLIGGITTNANRFADWLDGLTVPGGMIAFYIVGLLGLVSLAGGGSMKKVGMALLGVLAVVAFLGAGEGAVSEADDIGSEIGTSIDGGAGE